MPNQGNDNTAPVHDSSDEGAVGGINAPLPDFGLLSMIQNLKGRNSVDFFNSLEKVGKLSRWSKEQMLIIAEIKLEGPARKFYESSLKKVGGLNYETFKQSILTHFKEDSSFATDFARFSSAQQFEHESVKDFSVRLESLINKSFDQEGEDSEVLRNFKFKIILSQFVSGLKQNVKSPLIIQNPKTFKEAVDFAVRVEKSLIMECPNVNTLATSPQTNELVQLTKQQNDCFATMNIMMEKMAVMSDQLSKLKGEKDIPRQQVRPQMRKQVFCRYCQKSGHVEPECWKKERDNHYERQNHNSNRNRRRDDQYDNSYGNNRSTRHFENSNRDNRPGRRGNNPNDNKQNNSETLN
ncbi:hypothetical protein AVEN_200633-1 [Araneus ventricosus]|uniref:Retrotransposon gag domain-containing protein n=1 Tax=Araneus ventricosus TaxID=182803 RepID=A0A4Y2VH79_ARAVE|nr:hypothetical protein AVEN_200633-1 [Araneus ventricosus]